jgi:hypothetical protein
MLGLRYVSGAIPGKSLKRKTTESDDKRVSPVFNFIMPVFTKVIIIIIFAIFYMS